MRVVTEELDARRRTTASVALAVALTECAVTAAAAAASDLDWRQLADLFVVTNAAIGLSLALAGWPIAARHPHNLVGWSLLGAGCLYGFTATGVAVLAWLGQPTAPWRVLATFTNGSWTWALATFIPLSLATFPDGRLLNRRWRGVVVVLVIGGLLWTTSAVLDPDGGLTSALGIPGYPAWSGFWQIELLLGASSITLAVGWLASLGAIVIRYRTGSDQIRRQILWLLLATMGIVVCFAVDFVYQLESLLLGVAPILLIPLAIVIAVLRHQLLDIRLVVSRSLVYLLLTIGVVAAYLILIALLDQTLRRQVALDSSVLVTLVIALAFNPARVWLQRLINRAFYGARQDPVRAMTEVGARLGSAAGSGLVDVLKALCQVMRLPAASIVVDHRVVASYGELATVRHNIPLGSGADAAGDLVVGLRSGEHRPDPADDRVLTLLAAPLAVAVQARRLAEDLQASRERLVTTREEERRRIRRDLHDGLGPVLTAVVLNADAARLLVEIDPQRSSTLMASLRDQTIGAIEEIRRLVYELRPPALTGLGLFGALVEYAAVVTRRSDGGLLKVAVEAPSELGALPPAVEVAAYRIATEALTNVVRHSRATSATVRLGVAVGGLHLQICDNGTNDVHPWHPGIGLTSIGERSAELGGQCEIEHGLSGCSISVVLPLGDLARP